MAPTPLFISRKTQDPVQQPTYGTDMRTIERWARTIKTGAAGVKKLLIGNTGSHGPQLTVTPATGTGTVTIALKTTVDVTKIEVSQITPSSGSTSITIKGSTIVIKGSTDLYIAGHIKLLRTPTGVTGTLATAASFSKTVPQTTFEAALTYDTYRSFTCHRTTDTAAYTGNLQVSPTFGYGAGAGGGPHPDLSFRIVGQVWVPAGSTVRAVTNNAVYGTGYITALG